MVSHLVELMANVASEMRLLTRRPAFRRLSARTRTCAGHESVTSHDKAICQPVTMPITNLGWSSVAPDG